MATPEDRSEEHAPLTATCLALERSTYDDGAIQHHLAAVELSLVRALGRYIHDERRGGGVG